jgi:tRNA (cmo5U34)-methyltransferase
MSDNKTSSPAAYYDAHISFVNPHYAQFHDDTIEVVRAACPSPASWLDTGCGTGTLVAKALDAFPGTVFTLADPSTAMLEIAKAKLDGKNVEFVPKGTQELDFPDRSFDVITAIQAHHYFDAETRRDATANCYRMLKPGCLYVTFENIRPLTRAGLKIGMERWRRFQADAGRAPDEIEKHLARFDAEYFPITVEQHLRLLRDTGFQASEVLFAGLMQAGFYAIK